MNRRKIVIGIFGLALLFFSGASFYRSRHLKEPVVASAGVAKVVKLGDYFQGVRGTINDSNVYVLEGSEPGGTILVLGGSHPEEPGGGWRPGSWPNRVLSGRAACWSFFPPTGARRR